MASGPGHSLQLLTSPLPGLSKKPSSGSRKSELSGAGGYNAEPASDDSLLETDRAEHSGAKVGGSQLIAGNTCNRVSLLQSGGGQRRSKSEESLLERAELCGAKEAARSRRSSPLSHSGSVNQHLGRGVAQVAQVAQVASRRSQSREREHRSSEAEAGAGRSRIPLPVHRHAQDKEAEQEVGRYLASPEHPHTAAQGYVSSRYCDRYQPAAGGYLSSYNPSHLYTDYTVGQTSAYYRPSSAKPDYPRYNYYSSTVAAAAEPDSPRWRRRSYDHDSDYLRYQRRTSGRPSTSALSDYPAPPPATTAASASSALTRSLLVLFHIP